MEASECGRAHNLRRREEEQKQPEFCCLTSLTDSSISVRDPVPRYKMESMKKNNYYLPYFWTMLPDSGFPDREYSEYLYLRQTNGIRKKACRSRYG